jgi:hypothetical protein
MAVPFDAAKKLTAGRPRSSGKQRVTSDKRQATSDKIVLDIREPVDSSPDPSPSRRPCRQGHRGAGGPDTRVVKAFTTTSASRRSPPRPPRLRAGTTVRPQAGRRPGRLGRAQLRRKGRVPTCTRLGAFPLRGHFRPHRHRFRSAAARPRARTQLPGSSLLPMVGDRRTLLPGHRSDVSWRQIAPARLPAPSVSGRPEEHRISSPSRRPVRV